jgi:hypothetical protein
MDKKINYRLLAGVTLALLLALPCITLAGGATTISGIISNIANNLTGIAASLGIIGFTVAGILYITATGDPGKASIAKAALVCAIIGTLIAILAGSAEPFVKALTGV